MWVYSSTRKMAFRTDLFFIAALWLVAKTWDRERCFNGDDSAATGRNIMWPLKARDGSLVSRKKSKMCCRETRLRSLKQQGQRDRLSVGGKENIQTCLLRHGTLLEGETRHREGGRPLGRAAGWGVAGERGIFSEHPLAYCKFCDLSRFYLLKKKKKKP